MLKFHVDRANTYLRSGGHFGDFYKNPFRKFFTIQQRHLTNPASYVDISFNGLSGEILKEDERVVWGSVMCYHVGGYRDYVSYSAVMDHLRIL